MEFYVFLHAKAKQILRVSSLKLTNPDYLLMFKAKHCWRFRFDSLLWKMVILLWVPFNNKNQTFLLEKASVITIKNWSS